MPYWSVFIFHSNPKILSGGFIGVDIFFVISGFLITKILLREIETGKFSFSSFYIRRIFPALFAMLFCSLIVAVLVLGLVDLIWFCKTLKYSAVQLSNILFEKKLDYFDTKFDITPLLHTWSLAVEEQYYLIFPPILYCLFKKKKHKNFTFLVLAILTILSLIISQILLITYPKISFYSLASRFWELGIGGLIAFDKIKKPSDFVNEILGLLGLLMITISFFIINKENFPGIYALPACLGTALIIFSGQSGKTITQTILGNQIMVFFGLISYSLYLWHYPIIEFYKELSGSLEINNISAIALFISSVAISYLSYKFIETPFRKTRSLFGEKNLKILGYKIYMPFIVSLSFIIFFVICAISIKSWQNYEKKKIFSDSAKGREGSFNSECLIDKKVDNSENFIEKCVKGEKKKDFEILLIGDSHAWRYSNGLLEWAKIKNYSIATIATTKCPSFVDNGSPLCQDMFALINKTIKNNKNLKYVILANKWDDDVKLGEEFTKKLSKITEDFTKEKKQVVILGLVPVFKFDPVKCISRNHALIRQYSNLFKKEDCSKAKKSYTTPSDEFLTNFFLELVKKYNVKYFDPKKYFCDKEFCYSVINGKVLYTDFDHLDFDGSFYIAKYFDF